MRRPFHTPAAGRPDTFEHIGGPVFPLLPSASLESAAVRVAGPSGFPASHHIASSICARSFDLACAGSLMRRLPALPRISAPVDDSGLPVLSCPWRTPLWWWVVRTSILPLSGSLLCGRYYLCILYRNSFLFFFALQSHDPIRDSKKAGALPLYSADLCDAGQGCFSSSAFSLSLGFHAFHPPCRQCP